MSLLPEAISPAQFFAISWNCPKTESLKKSKKYCLPSTTHLFSEMEFSELYMGWSQEQISMIVEVSGRSDEDIVDLFFDTRDLKTKSTITKFCHHFRFTPEREEGYFGHEMTYFQGDDSHPLAFSKDLQIEVKSNSRSYQLKIELPSFCLFGYDPEQFPRMGFTYRIGRGSLPAQHFSVSDDEFSVEKNPSLWGTINLIK